METETCLWILNKAQSENDTLNQGEDRGNAKEKNRFRKKDYKEFDGYFCLFVLEKRMGLKVFILISLLNDASLR